MRRFFSLLSAVGLRVAPVALASTMLVLPAHAWLYTNTVAGFAIDNFTGKTFAVQSRVYKDSATSLPSSFDADAPVFFLDASQAVSPLHHFLGFCDFIVSPSYEQTSLPWKMYGDSDLRDLYDLRAMDGENTVWDMIDTNYKSIARGLAITNQSLWFTTTSLQNNPSSANFGEFTVARFGVPPSTVGGYYLSLGKQIVRIGSNGKETQLTGAVQLKVWTVNVTNALAVKATLGNNRADQFQDPVIVADISAVPGPINRVATGVPVTINAQVWNTSGNPVTRYEWNLGDGNWFDAGSSVTTTFGTTGTYTVGVRVTAGGLKASNLGSPCDEAVNFSNQMPDRNPSALPLVVTALAAPSSSSVGIVRPSPFVYGAGTQARLDIKLSASQNLTVSIYNLAGSLVRNLIAGPVNAGWTVAEWDGTDAVGRVAGDGIYYFAVTSSTLNERRKFHMVRTQ